MRIAIHQPNFIPWFPFFYKMAMVDKFILMKSVQFEKGGFQNRFMHKGKWITKPVHSGMCKIIDKDYIGIEGKDHYGDSSLARLNEQWIKCIAKTLNIDTQICDDDLYAPHPDDPTLKILDIIKNHTRGCKSEIRYITNPTAFVKYLDVKKFEEYEVKWDPCIVPKHLNKSIFEMFEEYGIEGTIKQLPKKEAFCKV